jgi:hypothetical protein
MTRHSQEGHIVPKDVWRDSLTCQRRAAGTRGGHILAQKMLHRVRAKPAADYIREQRVRAVAQGLLQPGFERGGGMRCQWRASFFALMQIFP